MIKSDKDSLEREGAGSLLYGEVSTDRRPLKRKNPQNSQAGGAGISHGYETTGRQETPEQPEPFKILIII
jgi:hypothetical protein